MALKAKVVCYKLITAALRSTKLSEEDTVQPYYNNCVNA